MWEDETCVDIKPREWKAGEWSHLAQARKY